MPEPITLASLLIAGASFSAGAAIAEATKDGYTALKSKVTELFGRSAADKLATLERRPDEMTARNAITAVADQAAPADLEALQPLITAFTQALAQDENARQLAHDRGRIDLVLRAAGNIEIARLDGVTSMNVRAAADGNFTLTDVTMGNATRGN